MTYTLKISYDDRDFLEIWNPKFEYGPEIARESGLYESFLNCAKVKGAKRAFDSLMIDAFSKCYQDVLNEVGHKEPALEKESYDVPELGLFHVRLSRILEEVYRRFVVARPSARVETADLPVLKL